MQLKQFDNIATKVSRKKVLFLLVIYLTAHAYPKFKGSLGAAPVRYS